MTKDVSSVFHSALARPGLCFIRADAFVAADENVLVPLLFRLTETNELPILLVGGRTVGHPKEIKYLAAKGELQKAITEAGGVVDGARKKKAKKL